VRQPRRSTPQRPSAHLPGPEQTDPEYQQTDAGHAGADEVRRRSVLGAVRCDRGRPGRVDPLRRLGGRSVVRTVDQATHRLDGGRLGESPVEQTGGLLPQRLRTVLAVEHRDDEPVTVAGRGADVRVPRQVRVAGLPADRTGVVVEQLVVVLDLETGVGTRRLDVRLLTGDLRGLRRGVLPEVGPGEVGLRDQGQVVRAGPLAGAVQSRGRRRVGVVGAQLRRGGVHRGETALDAVLPTGQPRQHVGRVVARHQHQPEQNRLHPVPAALDQPDRGATRLEREVARVHGHHLLGFDQWQRGECREQLQRAGRRVQGMRSARGEHLTGVQVGQHPGVGVEALGQCGRGALGQHEAVTTHPLPTHRVFGVFPDRRFRLGGSADRRRSLGDGAGWVVSGLGRGPDSRSQAADGAHQRERRCCESNRSHRANATRIRACRPAVAARFRRTAEWWRGRAARRASARSRSSAGRRTP